MTLVAMQPTYLPWAGYFNLIARADRFVFLDSVQFDKPSWQMRNRVLVQGGPCFVSVPTRGSRNQTLRDVEIDGHHWRSKHVRLLEQTYGKYPAGRAMLDRVCPVLLDESLEKLAELDRRLILTLVEALGLSADFQSASAVETAGARSRRLVELCRHFGERRYLSPRGSAGYIEEEGAFRDAGIEVEYQLFEPRPYAQPRARAFVPSLSIVDVVASLGWDGARAYVSPG